MVATGRAGSPAARNARAACRASAPARNRPPSPDRATLARPSVSSTIAGRLPTLHECAALNDDDLVDHHLDDKPFITGKRMTIADISMVGYLYYGDELTVPLEDFGGGHPDPNLTYAHELAELVGAGALELGQQNRIHRMRDVARRALALADPDYRANLVAYAEGVNAGLAALRAAPFEYHLLRVTPRPWAPEDSVLTVLAMFFTLQGRQAGFDRGFPLAVHEVAALGHDALSGGLGAGLMFFTPASLRPGVAIVLETTGFEALVREAHLVFTGEGRTDAQTAMGKAPVGVAAALLSRTTSRVRLSFENANCCSPAKYRLSPLRAR